MVPKDIWDCPDQIDEEECTPQMPHFTKQFENTLKDNKGSSNKADFEEVLESIGSPEFCRIKPSDEAVAGKLQKQKVKRKTKRKLGDYKPNTYNVKTSSKWNGLNLADKEKKLLRRIPSDQILKVLLT
ncbi:unnamed protein product [Moneuplotes crassus]|uniref:Uncharacterized protein n=1 Tax=Euplotes crassus TaxID=5936 RepID=A0AAD1X341_EUPCR|nr:unnamed protein product [Moneuplotes crassus]